MTARKKKTVMPAPPPERPKHKRGAELLATDLATLDRLRSALAVAAAAEKEARKDFEDFERYVADRMAFERVPAQRTEDRTFYLSHKPYPVVQDKAAFLDWARENEPELVADSIRKGDLNTALVRWLDDKQDLPPGLGYQYVTKVGSRAAPGA